MNKTEKAILKTLAFFDILNRPLTLEEIWQFLYKIHASKLQVLLGLEKLQKKEIIFKKNNYYFFSGRQKIVTDFENNQPLILSRFQKVHWALKILRYAPFVKNVSVINSLSFKTSKEDSDIDILIMTKKNRLWTARAFVVGLLEIIGQNKNKWFKAGKFCLGFAFDEERLNLTNLNPENYVHLPFWLAVLKPVLDRNMYKTFIYKNAYLKDDLPNWQPFEVESAHYKETYLEKILRGNLGNKIENWLGNIQLKRIWSDPKHLKAPEGSVIADFHMLKMHPDDRRKEYQKQWEQNIRTLTQKR